jgi:SAM-dependent methyltransferase
MQIVDSAVTSIHLFLRQPAVRWLAERTPLVRRMANGWRRKHPFDRQFGTDTSGYVGAEEILARASLNQDIFPYCGSQPSILRRALAGLPPVNGYTFLDLGCGKGRPSMVASEFPFSDIVGVDISRELLEVARQNAAIIQRRFPDRTPIRAVESDALKFMPDNERIVVFLFNPFPREVGVQLVQGIEKRLADGRTQMFIVSYNPVWASVIDASPAFTRYSAELYAYDRSEIGFGPDLADTVVVWQSTPAQFTPLPGASRGVSIEGGGWYAKLRDAKAV